MFPSYIAYVPWLSPLRHSAGEAQREAVRSAVSYFYRFAERHIDGETSAVSSAADVQAMQDPKPHPQPQPSP